MLHVLRLAFVVGKDEADLGVRLGPGIDLAGASSELEPARGGFGDSGGAGQGQHCQGQNCHGECDVLHLCELWETPDEKSEYARQDTATTSPRLLVARGDGR